MGLTNVVNHHRSGKRRQAAKRKDTWRSSAQTMRSYVECLSDLTDRLIHDRL